MCLHLVNFFLFQRLADQLDFLGIDVIFDRKVYLLLLSQIDDLLSPTMVIIKLFSRILKHIVDLHILFDLKLFNQFECCLLIILHVLIPSIGKLLVLHSLSIFNINKLSLLSNPHIMVLPLLLVRAPSIEDLFELVCHHVVPSILIPLSHFVHDPTTQQQLK